MVRHDFSPHRCGLGLTQNSLRVEEEAGLAVRVRERIWSKVDSEQYTCITE